MVRVTPAIAQATSDDTVEITPENSDEESSGDVDPESISDDTNPLNPAGDSLDKLIQVRFNEDVWTAMLGDLPCLDATEPYVRQLQEQAISNSSTLQAIDERVELINNKIEEAILESAEQWGMGNLEAK